MARLVVDGDAVVLALLRLDGIACQRLFNTESMAHLPLVTTRKVSGPNLQHQLAVRGTWQLDAWASEMRAASDLADAAVASLYGHYRRGTVAGGGHLCYFDVPQAPDELREGDQLNQLYRWDARLDLIVR